MKARKHDFAKVFEALEQKSGKSVFEIVNHAINSNKSKSEIKATEFYIWLENEFGLGRGHAQAIWINFESILKGDIK